VCKPKEAYMLAKGGRVALRHGVIKRRRGGLTGGET